MKRKKFSSRKKQSKSYTIFALCEKNLATYHQLAEYYHVSVTRIRHIHADVFIEMHKHPEVFRKNFLEATGHEFS